MSELLNPFGPSILVDEISSELIEILNRASDRILSDDALAQHWDWSHKLAGNVDQEVLLAFSSVEERDAVLSELRVYCARYYRMMREKDQSAARGAWSQDHGELGESDFEFQGMWLVNQKAGDFNPTHHHGGDFSSVLYLRLPEGLEEEWQAEDHYPTVGMIEFNDGRPAPFSRTGLRLRPSVGMLLMFPAWLPHTVYPFRSEGERRSLAFNVVVKPKSQAAV